MEKWVFLLTLLLILKSIADSRLNCRKRQSNYGGEELLCSNVSTTFFRHFDIPLNKTLGLTCANCSLEYLDESTFNIQRNNLYILYLTNSSIRSIKENSFSRFPTIRSLILKNNNIENIVAEAFHNLLKLTQLDLGRNFLRIITNNLFAEIKNLDLINLSDNHIFYIQPEGFSGLEKLKHLYLRNNQIHRLENNCFRHLKNLFILNLDNNKITALESGVFTNLKNLHSLYLNNNSISYLVPYNFNHLPSLENLQLRENNLTEIQTSSFNGLRNLKFLYLGRNRLTTIQPYGFIGLNNLQNLDLIDNSFTMFNLDLFKDMDSLVMLWLQRNNLNNLTINYKSDQFSSLISLGLSDNNLSTINYILLYNKMPKIKDIFIYNNSWKCEFLVNMYSFTQNKSVNLCASDDCNFNITTNYVEETCLYLTTQESVTENVDLDFTTSRASHCLPTLFALLVVPFCLLSIYFEHIATSNSV